MQGSRLINIAASTGAEQQEQLVNEDRTWEQVCYSHWYCIALSSCSSSSSCMYCEKCPRCEGTGSLQENGLAFSIACYCCCYICCCSKVCWMDGQNINTLTNAGSNFKRSFAEAQSGRSKHKWKRGSSSAVKSSAFNRTAGKSNRKVQCIQAVCHHTDKLKPTWSSHFETVCLNSEESEEESFHKTRLSHYKNMTSWLEG